jgi:hypothetical protein
VRGDTEELGTRGRCAVDNGDSVGCSASKGSLRLLERKGEGEGEARRGKGRGGESSHDTQMHGGRLHTFRLQLISLQSRLR